MHQVDATACRAIILRRGSGSLKHLHVKDLWVQAITKELGVSIVKVAREEMHAHILASPARPEELQHHLAALGAFRE